MIPYYGDFPVNATVYIPINTFDSNDPAASVTATNLLNTDVHIHKDGGATQRNNAAGVTMTIDFDSITGNHMLIIDTSDNTVADFFQAGHEYQVRVEGVTVDAGTLNSWVGCFSIERANGILALLKNGTYGLAQLVRSTTPANTLSVDAGHLVAVPATQKVDVETVKTNPVVNAGTVTFPANKTLAATDNITGGTITTVTNLTNAPADMATATNQSTIISALGTIAGYIDTEITTIANRIGAFTGSGVNTILGFFKALMGKGASNPSDLGALTFDAATDSVEGIRDTAPLGTAMRGTDSAMLATAKPTVGGYDTGQDPVTLMNADPPDVNAKTISDAAIKSTTFTAGSLDAAAAAADLGSELAAALLDLTNAIETGLTVRNALRLAASNAAGDLSGAGTGTEVLKSAISGSKSRITGTIDESGNRTIATDLT